MYCRHVRRISKSTQHSYLASDMLQKRAQTMHLLLRELSNQYKMTLLGSNGSSTCGSSFSTTAAPPAAAAAGATSGSIAKSSATPEVSSAPKKAAPIEKEGIFSKHGGKMVLGFLGALGLWFLRNHLGSKRFDALKDEVEAVSPLEPEEVEQLRCLNDYPPPTFRKVLDSAREAFPSGRATYPEFVRHVTASGLLPEPLFSGNLLDRLVLSAAAHKGILGAAARGEPIPPLPSSREAALSGNGRDDSIGLAERGSGVSWSGGEGEDRESAEVLLDMEFLMVAFSAAVNSTPSERIDQLWDMMREDPVGQTGEDTTRVGGETIPVSRVEKLIGLLLAGQQLPVGRYVVKDETRGWPVQQHRLASGRDVLLKGLEALHEEQEKRSKGWLERKVTQAYDPASEEKVSYELFEKVLRSGPVCAWGECFGRSRHNKL